MRFFFLNRVTPLPSLPGGGSNYVDDIYTVSSPNYQ